MAILNATYAPIYGEMEEVVLYWYSRKVLDGKSFADLFEFEGLPLGWFYERMFFLVMMPKQLNMYELLKNGKRLTTTKKAEFAFYSSALPKLISLNEKRKRNLAKVKSVKTDQQKILFLTFTNHLEKDGKIYRLQEIIDEISARKKMAPFPILVDPFSSSKYNLLKDKNSIYQYSDNEIIRKAKAKSKEMHQKIYGLSEEQKEKIFSLGEKNFWPYCKYVFNFNFSREMLFQLMFHYYLFDKIIREEKIACGVLTSPGSSTEKCLIAAAKKNNIPALVIQHGMGVTDQPINNAGSAHYALFGAYHQKQLLHWDISKENIHITGPVIHNDISKYNRKKNKQKVKEILIATQTLIEVNLIPKEVYFECFKKIISVLQSIPNAHITIKTHPREVHHQEYDALISENVSTNHLKGNKNLYTLLSQCDLLINFYGTSTVLEAAILDKPCITIDLPNLTQNFYQDYDPSYRIKYNDNIKEKVQELLENPALLQEKRKKLVKEWCYLVDGKAHQRVVDVIEKLSGK